MAKDAGHFRDLLSPPEQHALLQVLGFFSAADALVNENVVLRFWEEIDILEARYFYGNQIAIENIHAEMYAILINSIITDERTKKDLFESILSMPVVAAIGDFIRECCLSKRPLQERLFSMSCIEGILFIGCFQYIFWLQHRKLMPGLAQSNEFISRDEALHTTMPILLEKILFAFPIKREVAEPIMSRIMGLSDALMEAMFPKAELPGMNATLSKKYVRYVADNHLHLYGLPPMYHVTNPFDFMDNINVRNQTDFFIRAVTEYGKPATSDQSDYGIESDF